MTKYEDKCLVSIRSVLESLLVLTSFDKGIGFRHIVMTLVCRISSIFFNLFPYYPPLLHRFFNRGGRSAYLLGNIYDLSS